MDFYRLDNITDCNDRQKTGANTGLAKNRVQCPAGSFVLTES